MKFVISLLALLIVLSENTVNAGYRADTLKKAAIQHTDYDPEKINQPFDTKKSALGKKLFEDKTISFNGGISCRECHLDEFSSGDGLPVAIGIGAEGRGIERVSGDGEVLTRNTLPLWGRGGIGFRTFFWDGKVTVVDGIIISQFGSNIDNGQALNIAVHLPFAELDEMVRQNDEVSESFKKEEVDSAEKLFDAIVENVKNNPKYVIDIESTYQIKRSQITFDIIADSIVHFIRDSFALKQTYFYQFLLGQKDLSDEAIDGGLLFYGKGKCVICHSGPYFSDFDFHVIPTPQLGYGKNGFGVDYGRFNVSHEYQNVYAFRTPPLYDVSGTGPYMHSGSISTMEIAVKVHFDPLSLIDITKMSVNDRVEFYRKIRAAGTNIMEIPFLNDDEVSRLIEFLRTLSFVVKEN